MRKSQVKGWLSSAHSGSLACTAGSLHEPGTKLGVAVTVAGGVPLAVAVALGVAVSATVGVRVGGDVGVWVEVDVGVDVAAAVGVGDAVGVTPICSESPPHPLLRRPIKVTPAAVIRHL